MAKDCAGWVGTMVGVAALGFAAQQYCLGAFATTKIDNIKGYNGFLSKEKPVVLFAKAIPEAVEQKHLREKPAEPREKPAEPNQTMQNTLAQKESVIDYFAQGVAFAQQKDWKSAEASFRRAINLDPNYAEAYTNLGVTLDKQDKTIEAIAAYQKAIQINPNYAPAYYNLGVALDQQGKTIEAIAKIKKARDLYRAQGDTQEAEKIIQFLEKAGIR